MSQVQRLAYVNSWPNTTMFTAEIKFQELLKKTNGKQLFFPCLMPPSANPDAHITISYLIDSLSSLPNRPDHAFDWIWRAFESIISSAKPGVNITESLKKEALPRIVKHLKNNKSINYSFFKLIDHTPLQTCEYLLKNIINSGPYCVAPQNYQALSKFAKRLLLENGNGPITSIPIQFFLSHLANNYDYTNTDSRRNGASLLRSALRGKLLTIGGQDLQLDTKDRLFLLISGLSYTYRNDRAHANAIAPFQSSTAEIKTYAHCWFMFLLVYKFLIIYLHTQPSYFIFKNCPSLNFYLNSLALKKIFGRHLNQ